MCVEQSIPGCASLIQEPVQEDSSGHARTHEIRRAMQLEEDRRNNGCGIKQVWMMFDGKSRPLDIGVDEQGRELKERWEKENGMAVGEVRLMAEGRMIGWDDLANLADGTVVQVLGNICGGMGKKSRKKKEKNPWESDGSGVPSWAQEVPWSDGSSAVIITTFSRYKFHDSLFFSISHSSPFFSITHFSPLSSISESPFFHQSVTPVTPPFLNQSLLFIQFSISLSHPFFQSVSPPFFNQSVRLF